MHVTFYTKNGRKAKFFEKYGKFENCPGILVKNRKRIDCITVFVNSKVKMRTCTQACTSYKTNLSLLSVYKITLLAGNFAHMTVQGLIS